MFDTVDVRKVPVVPNVPGRTGKPEKWKFKFVGIPVQGNSLTDQAPADRHRLAKSPTLVLP
jgi:hypothetical protein